MIQVIIFGININLHTLENLRRLNCQFDICSSVHVWAPIGFFHKFRAFFYSRNSKCPPFSLLLKLIFHLFLNILSRPQEKWENIAILSTTPSHCTLMAEPDYRICISLLVEFYKITVSNYCRLLRFTEVFVLNHECKELF